ncbi:MAG: hypothetical protein C0596_07370 [Marinilabiliales bacterium]|nr:MAG: hypothetical protein C0596_07370 [Marinilabiliales bacterium]
MCVPASSVNVPVPLYDGVPPEPVTVTVVVPPLHAIAPELDEAVNRLGSFTTIFVLAVHQFASVTV